VQVYSGDGFQLSVVAGARYLFGESATYVIPSSVRIIDADNVAFETTRSRTDLVTTQIGVGLRF
jgi:hypothetical protein